MATRVPPPNQHLARASRSLFRDSSTCHTRRCQGRRKFGVAPCCSGIDQTATELLGQTFDECAFVGGGAGGIDPSPVPLVDRKGIPARDAGSRKIPAQQLEVGIGFHLDPGFGHVLKALHRRTGRRVAVLIDEYDRPILDALDTPEVARANRDYLRGLYAVLKSSDADIRFSLMTGVTKFSKVSLFSGLNNLKDITLDRRCSSICGYTEEDLDTVFEPELPGLDRERIRDWYNGYGWLGDERVYNPFDILLLFDERKFGAWWFETGTPAFLVETLFKRRVSSVALDGMLGTGDLLSAFDVGAIATEALLFQTGYLTIAGEENLGGESLYRLGYPNREVRQSLNRSLLRYLVRDVSGEEANRIRLRRLLAANDFAGLKTLFQAFYASIPCEWYTNNDIARYEGYCASVFYSYFAGLGLDITVEDSTSHGRLDMAVRFNGNVYLFELK